MKQQPKAYKEAKYNIPDVFEGKHPNSKVLIISSGPSTKEILPYKKEIKKYFDVVIAVNHGFKYFDELTDYHIVTEKPSPTNHVAEMLNEAEYRRDIPRIINWKGLPHYNHKYNLHKIVRQEIRDGFSVRKYTQVDGSEGMLTGKPNKRNMAVGSVTLSSMHLACILGASEIYLIGADMIFKDQYDHFYPDNQYRDPNQQNKVKPVNRVHVVEVEHNGKKYTTTDYFRDSAVCINEMIKTTFSSVKIHDFSDGLITTAIPLKVDEFFGKSVN